MTEIKIERSSSVDSSNPVKLVNHKVYKRSLLLSQLTVPRDDSDIHILCEECRECFDEFFNDNTGKWHVRPAVRDQGFYYHPNCFDDLEIKKEIRMLLLKEVKPNVSLVTPKLEISRPLIVPSVKVELKFQIQIKKENSTSSSSLTSVINTPASHRFSSIDRYQEKNHVQKYRAPKQMRQIYKKTNQKQYKKRYTPYYNSRERDSHYTRYYDCITEYYTPCNKNRVSSKFSVY